MAQLPPSLTAQSTQWSVAVGLTVVGDLASMLATFMPMKVVLILASGDVPGFFPSFLVNGGAVFASLVLLLIAGLLGVMAWGAGVVITRLDQGYVLWVGGSSQLSDGKTESYRAAKKARTFQSSIIVTVPVIAVLVLVSPPYLAFSILWLAGSAVGVALWVRRSPNQAPFFSGVDHVSHSVAKWLRGTALGAMVGLALITLLLAPPALGSTAILIAAIFGRRLIIAVATLAPRAAVEVTSRAHPRAQSLVGALVTNKPTAEAVRWPIEFLSSAVGSRRLGQHLEAAGFARHDFQVVGASTGRSLSLIAGPRSSRQLLIRVFGIQHEEARNRELTRRQYSDGLGVYPAITPQRGVMAGFPAIEVPLNTPDVLADLDTPVDRDKAFIFQLEREFASVLAFAEQDVPAPFGLNAIELVERLKRVGRIPGEHSPHCYGLTPRVNEALAHLDALPPALVPAKPLWPANFYNSQEGHLCYLGGQTWSAGRMGDSWAAPNNYEKHLKALVKTQGQVGTLNVDAVMLNAELHALNRALVWFQLQAVTSAVERVHKRLDSLAKK